MEIKIGVQGVARELVVDVDLDQDQIAAAVQKLSAGPDGMLDLVDTRGRRVLVPGSKLAFVEIVEPEVRRVGFGVS